MNTDRETLKLALEALEGIHVGNMTPMAEENWNKAITALRQALAQQKLSDSIRPKGKSITKVWVDEINQALEQPECNQHPDAPHGFNRESSHSLGRYVCDCEGWEPEPVAWASIKNGYPNAWVWNPEYVKANPNVQLKLYTAPPKRKWVGLTDEEVLQVVYKDYGKPMSPSDTARAIEAELKEKNYD